MSIFSKMFTKKEKKNSGEQDIEVQKKIQLQKGDVLISAGDNQGFKVLRKLTDEQKKKIDQSTIPVMVGTQLYMHYWSDTLVCTDPNDQTWQNQVIFFWEANEPFPKKSLPPIFETFKVKNFIFVSSVPLSIGQAMPWFGMPGLGKKHFCEIHEQKVSIPELNKLGIIEYLENIELTSENSDILTDLKQHFFLVDESIVQFKNNSFYLEDKIIPIEVAYSIGGIHVMKRISR